MAESNASSSNQIKCKLCNVWCSGIISYRSHIQGMPHFKKLQFEHQSINNVDKEKNNSPEEGNMSEVSRKIPVTPEEFKCDLCNISVLGKDQFDTHMSGSRHAKRAKMSATSFNFKEHPSIEVLPNADQFRCNVCNSGILVGISTVISHVGGFRHQKKVNNDGHPKIQNGSTSQEMQESLKCELCNVAVNTTAQLEIHNESVRHKHRASLKRSADSDQNSSETTPPTKKIKIDENQEHT